MAFAATALDRFRSGAVSFGVWSLIPSPYTAEVMAAAGADFICLDQQHGLIDPAILPLMVSAVIAGGALPFVRVPSNDAAAIGRAFDHGALGVIVPMIENAGDARRAVAACRYPPEGTRSFGPVRAERVIGSADPVELSKVICIVMVETADGLRNVDEIAATPGLDGIFIGPADLAIALGLPPRGAPRPQALQDAMESIRISCAQHEIVVGTTASDGSRAREAADDGYRMITIGMDATLLDSALRAELAAAKG
jgi:4-hydroxy-2-oxoheptanedioate aldolase